MARPTSMPLRQKISWSLGKMVRRKTDDASEYFDGPHWRPSINSLLRMPDARLCRWDGPGDAEYSHEHCRSQYLDLPRELQDIIESYLSHADLLCLRQTCTLQRRGDSFAHTHSALTFQLVEPLQIFSYRSRLDREYYPLLCELETNPRLIEKHAACSFCHTLHPTKSFTKSQLTRPPSVRRCSLALRNYLICGNFWANPLELRDILTNLDPDGGDPDHSKVHDFTPRIEHANSKLPLPVPIATIIENTLHICKDRAYFSISPHGLTLTHHFHLQSQAPSPFGPAVFSFASALASPRRGVSAICPHLTVHSAGIRLGRMQSLADGFSGECPEKACETVFGWFVCDSETTGWRDLCFRVERRFAWVEALESEFWKSQTMT